jgi:chemotaxis regulatin CheY-phosphate phosphatase CheZ
MLATDAIEDGLASTGKRPLNRRAQHVTGVLQGLAARRRALRRHLRNSNVDALVEELAEAAPDARRRRQRDARSRRPQRGRA